MRLKDILKESTEASDIIKDLDKVRTDLIKKVDVLIAKKKKLYSDVDITTPMSADEKKLDKDIQDIFSQIQQIIQQKRKIKTESVNEGKYYVGYNKGRGQGIGVFKDVFSTYKDAKKEVEKIEKQRGGSYNQIAYYVADVNGKFVTESLNEYSYDLGKKQYTDKNLTPTEILDLAMAYANTSISKMSGGKLSNIINSANDLAKLNGTTQLDAKTRGKQPALIVFLLKNKLVTRDEYIKLYKNLIEKQISVVKVLKNADPASRMVGGAAARQAYKDMKGEFDESNVNEVGINKMYVKFLAVSKKVRELEDAQKELSQKYFTEKDLNKKEALLTQLKKGTETLKGFRRNLSDIEEKYVMNLDTEAELDL